MFHPYGLVADSFMRGYIEAESNALTPAR